MPPKRSRASGSNKKTKFYAVAAGRLPGIYTTWDECKEQTLKFKSAKFKSFDTKGEAQDFIDKYRSKDGATTAKEIDAPASKRQRRDPTHIISMWIHFDGGSRGNPGLGGSGAQLIVSKVTPDTQAYRHFLEEASSDSPIAAEQILHIRKYLGKYGVTNNQAEYHGLLASLEEGLTQTRAFISAHNKQPNVVFAAKIKVKGDSDLIMQQMKGNYEVKSEKLQPLYKQVCQAVSKIKQLVTNQLDIDYDHVYRSDNAIADGLANEAMDSQKSWTSVVANRNVAPTNNVVDIAAIDDATSAASGSNSSIEGGIDV